jgi:hypothetical protein
MKKSKEDFSWLKEKAQETSPDRRVRGPMIRLHRVKEAEGRPAWVPVWVNAFELVMAHDNHQGYTLVTCRTAPSINVHESLEEVLSLIEEATAEPAKKPPTPEQLEQYVHAARSIAEMAKRIFSEELQDKSGGMPS